jgi:hypothetical protein
MVIAYGCCLSLTDIACTMPTNKQPLDVKIVSFPREKDNECTLPTKSTVVLSKEVQMRYAGKAWGQILLQYFGQPNKYIILDIEGYQRTLTLCVT